MLQQKTPYTFNLIERDKKGHIRFHYVIIDLIADFLSGEPHPADDAIDAGWFSAEQLKVIELSKNNKELLRKIQFIPEGKMGLEVYHVTYIGRWDLII